MHLDVAAFKDGPDFHGEGLAALVAFVSTNTGAFTGHLGDALESATMRAYRTVRPYSGLYELVGCGLVVEVFI